MKAQDMTFPEFLAHCKEHGRTIFVRAHVKGKWGSHSFGQLSPALQYAIAEGWYQDNRFPVRVVDEE